jgi:dihydroorotase
MAKIGMLLLIHGEVTDPTVDIFDREKVFIETILKPIISKFPTLKVVMEHITTSDAVEFVKSSGPNLAATITAHHLLYNRNAIFQGGVCPHMYCLPILKREEHRHSLLSAATSGNPKFFIGTDSAPHSIEAKESACGCAGIFTAHAAIELYAEAFESVNGLEKLENFCSKFGQEFYGIPKATKKILLQKEEWTVPEKYLFGASYVRPLRANQKISWKKIS